MNTLAREHEEVESSVGDDDNGDDENGEEKEKQEKAEKQGKQTHFHH